MAAQSQQPQQPGEGKKVRVVALRNHEQGGMRRPANAAYEVDEHEVEDLVRKGDVRRLEPTPAPAAGGEPSAGTPTTDDPSRRSPGGIRSASRDE